MIMAQEKHFIKAQEEFDVLLGWIDQTDEEGLRIDQVELGLFCSETHQVEPVGTMYGVVERRSGVQESMLYQTEEQAKHAILRRMPKQQIA